MKNSTRVIAVLLIGGMLAAACSGGTADDVGEVPSVPEPSDGLPLADEDGTVRSGVGPGISVNEALASNLDGPLLVNGYLFVYHDGSVVLADLIAESFPPQPGGATVTVEGADLMQIPLTEGPTDGEIEITAWTETPIQLLGEIVEGAFVVNPAASA